VHPQHIPWYEQDAPPAAVLTDEEWDDIAKVRTNNYELGVLFVQHRDADSVAGETQFNERFPMLWRLPGKPVLIEDHDARLKKHAAALDLFVEQSRRKAPEVGAAGPWQQGGTKGLHIHGIDLQAQQEREERLEQEALLASLEEHSLHDSMLGSVPMTASLKAEGPAAASLEAEAAQPSSDHMPFSGAGRSIRDRPLGAVAPAAPVQEVSYDLVLAKSQQVVLLLNFHDGEQLRQNFNLTHTVQDICLFMASQKPLPFGITFELHVVYSQRVLDDPRMTIDDAQLQGCSLIQMLDG